MKIFLTGLSGTGKTAVGEILAKRLNYKFADTDKLVETESGKSVARIFEDDGEKAFRILETKALKSLLPLDDIVISTGGGTLVAEENRNVIRADIASNVPSAVFQLCATADTIASRLFASADSSRPLLDTGDLQKLKEKIQKMETERKKFYDEISDYKIITDGKTCKETALQIEKIILSGEVREA